MLADSGHNITFVNIVSSGLDKCVPHPNIHAVNIIVWDGEDKDMMWKDCIADVMKGDSGYALEAFGPSCIEVWREVWKRSAGVFSGLEVLDMFSRTQFDVILGEKVENTGLALLGTVTNVPVVNYEPSFMIELALIHNNLPMLVFSQPSLLLNHGFHRSPLFTEKLSVLKDAFIFLPFIQSGAEAMQPFVEKFGFSSLRDVKSSVKLYLTNDHPAFTFPFLRPPNDIPIGCANLLERKHAPIEFSPQIAQFLEKSVGKDVIYVSFGSYAKMSDVSWFSELINILIELDLRVIVKVDKSCDKIFPESVLPLHWAPQKDLLRSGKVKVFLNHCGNNGRLETIFYNVPALCIPQFADQFINAELVKLKGFGESLMKEDIPYRAREVVTSMITNHGTYRGNMKKASDIVENEPGNVRENLVFYVGHVAKFGNVDYLVNVVTKQQNMAEIYYLDIIIPACVIGTVLVGLLFYALVKLYVIYSNGMPILSLKFCLVIPLLFLVFTTQSVRDVFKMFSFGLQLLFEK